MFIKTKEGEQRTRLQAGDIICWSRGAKIRLHAYRGTKDNPLVFYDTSDYKTLVFDSEDEKAAFETIDILCMGSGLQAQTMRDGTNEKIFLMREDDLLINYAITRGKINRDIDKKQHPYLNQSLKKGTTVYAYYPKKDSYGHNKSRFITLEPYQLELDKKSMDKAPKNIILEVPEDVIDWQ